MSVTMVTKSSGNVFEDLGFDREEAANLKIRSQLMIKISEHIKAKGLNQTEAARALGITQPKVSNLLKGHIDKFTIDKLTNMLARIGYTTEVKVKKAPRRTAEVMDFPAAAAHR